MLDDRASVIAGELYVAADLAALLGELDAIETFRGFGAPGSLYRRAIIGARRPGLASTLAWTYVFTGPRDGSRPIASGDWRERRRP